MDEISDKHKSFCHALIKHKYNQYQAYKEVYGEKSGREAIDVEASKLVRNPKVKEYLSKLTDKQEEKALVTVQEVIDGIISDIGEARVAGQYGASLKGRELLGKYLAMFTDKVQHSGDIKNTLTFEQVAAKNDKTD